MGHRHHKYHTRTYKRTLSLPCCLSVCLYSVGGAAALCYTSTTTIRFFPTAITLTTATMVTRPATFCYSLLAPHSVVLRSAILLHSSHQMIGLPSALFVKLIAAIKVGSGNVIQFNSVLMPRLKALSMCDNFRGV